MTEFNAFPNKPWFLCVYSTSLLKTLQEKEELLVTSNFSFSHRIFYSFGELSAIFIKLKICCSQTLSVWKSLNFAIWEKVRLVQIAVYQHFPLFPHWFRTFSCSRSLSIRIVWKSVNSVPNIKILDRSKLKAFAEDKINVTEILKFVLEG